MSARCWLGKTDSLPRNAAILQGLAQVVEIAGCGHAPVLNVPDPLDRVAAFIKAAR